MLKRWIPLFALLAFVALPVLAFAQQQDEDADLPGALRGQVDKDWYLKARQEQIDVWTGVGDWLAGPNPRVEAIKQLQQMQSLYGPITPGAWTPLGPAPIPNGQTTNIQTPVSGRVTAIVVNPTNPNVVYVGTAQGGVYRSLDGGATWVALTDNALSLAIGALALAPSNPSILYVGTGEASGSCDSYFGVGLYRIDNADTAPVLNGPFNPTPTTDVIGAQTFTGRTISAILVKADDPATIFVSTNSGIGGLSCDSYAATPPRSSLRGIYRSTDATSASPNFAKLTVTPTASIAPDVTGNRPISDMIFDPTDPTGNTILTWVLGNNVAADGGIYRTTNALAANPVFTQTFITTVSNARGTFAANRVAGVTTMIVGTGETSAGTTCLTSSQSGALRVSLDGGVTWGPKLAGGGGYCGGQCFYDLPVALKPDDASVILIGGAGNSSCARVFARSVNAGATFTGAGGADVGLHADAHAIAFSQSNSSVVYFGSDGGVWRSDDAGATWTSRNTAGFSATQFQSLAMHPLDRWFTIGGTQDNGTPMYQPDATWRRADFGDGGFALIDQNATDVTNVTMYHTYFNQQNNLVGYARVFNTASAVDAGWTFLGNNANGISVADRVQFYAPMALGPGNPNTVYYGTMRLYRSVDNGTNNVVVSQTFSAGGVLSTIGISPQNDNVRIVGTNNGLVFMTQTGANPMTNVTSAGFPVSNTNTRYVSKTIIDPNNTNTAWVAFGGFGLPAGQHVWKTTNLAGGAGTWVAAGNGLPDVPVNTLVIDPNNSNDIYAGTDIGVYRSSDGGASWLPFVTGMPVVAVFDIGIQQFNRTLRCATHGRGIWERLLDTAVPTLASLVGSEVKNGHVLLSWYTGGNVGSVTLYRRYVPGAWEKIATLPVDGAGHINYDDANVLSYGTYDYRLGFLAGGQEQFAGDVRVDVGAANRLALAGMYPNPTAIGMRIRFTLPNASAATIEVVDASGRRMISREVGTMGAGQHELDLRSQKFAPGVYWIRLKQADHMFTSRAVVLASSAMR